MAGPLALVKLVTVGLSPRARRGPPTPTPGRAPSLWVLDTLLAAPLFVETKQRASGGWFSAPRGDQVAVWRLRLLGSWSGRLVVFCWGFGFCAAESFPMRQGALLRRAWDC